MIEFRAFADEQPDLANSLLLRGALLTLRRRWPGPTLWSLFCAARSCLSHCGECVSQCVLQFGYDLPAKASDTRRKSMPKDGGYAPLFSGVEEATRGFLRVQQANYYVYALCLPDLSPFYIGKGVNNRVFDHVLEARRNHKIGETNPHKCNKIRKLEAAGIKVHYSIVSLHETNVEAEREESRLIAKFGRAPEGGPLTNLAAGRESKLELHPESRAKHAATLGHDPRNPSKDPETRVLNEFMSTIVPVRSTPLKPRSKYRGNRVRHTTGTTRSTKPKPRSAGALAVVASLNGGNLDADALIPRTFVYDGIPGILENGVSNDIIGTGIAEIVSAADPADEQFRITVEGANTIRSLLGAELLYTLGLIA